MSPILYALCARLFPLLQSVGVGTNLGLLQIFFSPDLRIEGAEKAFPLEAGDLSCTSTIILNSCAGLKSTMARLRYHRA